MIKDGKTHLTKNIKDIETLGYAKLDDTRLPLALRSVQEQDWKVNYLFVRIPKLSTTYET